MMKPSKAFETKTEWQTHLFFLETVAASLRQFDLIGTDSKESTCPQNCLGIFARRTIEVSTYEL